MSAHNFIEVKDRRWCTCCDLFQSKSPTAAYFPTPRNPCPRNTPHARALEQQTSTHPLSNIRTAREIEDERLARKAAIRREERK